ncbi:MAG: hypothetical protein LAQ30_14210 [Acidobacteriia bacterium]|nr:hypothetical protein [Terriglobia bacterium]
MLEAIRVNQPTRIVMNHLDYVDAGVHDRGMLTGRALAFPQKVASEIVSLPIFAQLTAEQQAHVLQHTAALVSRLQFA